MTLAVQAGYQLWHTSDTYGEASRAILIFLAGTVLLAPRAAAQGPGRVTLGFGGGLLVADNGPSDYLRGRGLAAFLRGGFHPRGPVSVILDTWIQHAPRNEDIVFSPCPLPPGPCPRGSFVGPTTVLTIAPAIEAGDHRTTTTLFVRVGPSVHWFVDRAVDSDALATGVRAGVSVPIALRSSRLLVSVDFMRPFRAEQPPRWLLPITIGWEF